MPAIINTNIASLNAQRNLNSSQSALQTSLQRLSSGLRINSAKDDAAGLAISERFSTQIRGLNQAARNANDGISLAQTGEGALAAVTDNLQRIRELAVQAANSTNSVDDRAALQLEVAQRLAEIDRTATQTSFNGQKLLDGSFTAAAFQIGANAGETISVTGLGTGVRLSATGQIAQATSTVLGNTATGGSITTGAITPADFSLVTSNGSVSFTATDNNFQSLIAGKSSPITVTSFDNDGASAAIDGSNVQGSAAPFTQTNFSGAALAQFNITDGINTANITLNADYGTVEGLRAAIEAQMQAAGGNLATSTVTNNAGVLTFTNVGQTAALAISNVDVNATNAGFVASAGTAGAALNTQAQFDVDGTTITMTTDSVDITGFAADLTTKLQGSLLADAANYSAAVVNGAIEITHAGQTTAVAITAPNAKATASGITASTGVAGTADAGSGSVVIDGNTVTLDQNYASYDVLAAAIQTQLGVNYVVANTAAGAFTITRAGAAGTALGAIAISNPLGGAAAAGLGVNAGTAGSATTTSASLTVDGQVLTLTGNDSTLALVASDLETQLDAAFGAGVYTAVDNGTGIVITNTTLGSAAVSLTATNAAAVTAGFGTLNVPATGTAGLTSGSVTLADLSINGTSLAGTYADAATLATSINTNVTGVYATVSNGALTLSSSAAMTLAGATDTAAMGLTAGAVAANSGTLATASVTTAAAANTTIQRIDSALTAVSNLRSTFGAIQNRFESVISSLSATSENLTAARSRIQDTDFAAETAQLTRNQILQQAGTAMLAQANQLPNTVLSLLR